YTAECDLVVVDHYGLDAAYERPARTWAKRIVVIDDLADRHHDCDVLIDSTFGRNSSDYKSLVPVHCKILCGANYAMLRPQFAALRAQSLARRATLSSPPRVLISLGSTNVGNVTGKVLAALESYTAPLSLDVVMGSGAAHLDDIKTGTLHIDTPNMAALMASADIAIGAGGTTSWERCCLGLPTILIELADNQSLIASSLHDAGAVLNIGLLNDLTAQKIHAALDDILNNAAKREAMIKTASAICDGRGTERILPLLYPPRKTKTGQQILSLQRMEAAD
ncbi:MAG TPA: UDP-2,4-diacetamido-2,4,6-trideoxy-beta-L-altropyranose hydrolase, partial [Alphaproteobacteria bacterium]|nr:UDP-2,4-diacetamido-2,4,6-trideoxy-beta-L-altropyranose hydrolase [Alphaproteobacteria bacterium]